MKALAGMMAALAMTFVAGSEAPKITVSAAGTAKVVPTALQVWVTLKEKGADAAGAVQALKTAQEKVATKLATLGVKGEQIKCELPVIVDKAAQNQARMRQSGGRLKRKPAAPEEKPEVEMQQMVRVLVPLSAKDATGLMVEAEAIKAKVIAAKLSEEKPAEGEAGEEELRGFNDYENQAMGPVSFVFYAAQSDEAQNQALADAVKKATDSAARAAKAMGKPAPELHSLMVQADSVDQSMNYYRYGGRYGRQVEMPPQEDGLTSQTPQITVYAQISAEFHFK